MEYRRIIVPVATLWSDPKQLRPIDHAILTKRANLRTWLDGQNDTELAEIAESDLITTQVLYNERVAVMDRQNNWLLVQTLSQPTDRPTEFVSGWLPELQTSADVDPVGSPVTVAETFAELYDDNQQPRWPIVMGTQLDGADVNEQWAQIRQPNGEIGYLRQSALTPRLVGATNGERLANLGREFLGLRYLWGGTTPYGFDGSGLAYALHRQVGITIPRNVSHQILAGQPVNQAELLPGDLLFFAGQDQAEAVQVAIYLGYDQLIRASRTGGSIQQESFSHSTLFGQFIQANRYWESLV
ncbi:C40 family peptidase [Levilactobacillus bambusae]|uniref:NlpC/P60 domain-containing protein n=1 Tax=Levilactobacillus bambusae TaxID=2024736 RepID=A0A2V1N1G1_9LACO|nr:C40 family peptidase [Levilactobacillus bambusae]PWG00912.1 hypothetical protein DCM90_01685 [Levilactobacillus bambusae]